MATRPARSSSRWDRDDHGVSGRNRRPRLRASVRASRYRFTAGVVDSRAVLHGRGAEPTMGEVPVEVVVARRRAARSDRLGHRSPRRLSDRHHNPGHRRRLRLADPRPIRRACRRARHVDRRCLRAVARDPPSRARRSTRARLHGAAPDSREGIPGARHIEYPGAGHAGGGARYGQEACGFLAEDRAGPATTT